MYGVESVGERLIVYKHNVAITYSRGVVKVKEVFCPQTAATEWHFYQGLQDSVSKWYLLVV